MTLTLLLFIVWMMWLSFFAGGYVVSGGLDEDLTFGAIWTVLIALIVGSIVVLTIRVYGGVWV